MLMTYDWFAFALLSAVFAALTAIFAKVGLDGIDSDYATLIRTLVILTFLAGIVIVKGKWVNPLSLSSKSLWFLILSGVAAGLSWLCYFRALQMGEASKVAPIDKFSVLFVAVFAVIFLGERPSWEQWSGLLLVGLGVVILGIVR